MNRARLDYSVTTAVIPASGVLQIARQQQLRRLLAVGANAASLLYFTNPLLISNAYGWRVAPGMAGADPLILLHDLHGCVVEREWWISGTAGTIVQIVEGWRIGV